MFCGLWNLRRLGIEIDGPRVVRAGEEFRIRVVVRNQRRWLDAVGLKLRIIGPGGLDAATEVPWVVSKGEAMGELRVRCEGRGDGSVLKYRLGSSFPWSLMTAETRGEVAIPLTVLPRPIVPVEILEGGSDQERDGVLTARRRESSGVPRAMREFRAGDRMRDVSWPASVRAFARGTGLVVREWDPPGLRPRKVTLLFHSYGADGMLIRPDRFERAVSLAWGTLGHLQAAGVELRWLADFQAWVPVTVRSRRDLGKLGDELAGCGRHASTERHELEGRLEDCRGEVWIFSDMPPACWMPVVDAFPQARVVDVTRFEQGRRLAFEGRAHA